jgi:hypothetical protein
LYALAEKIMKKKRPGSGLIKFLQEKLSIELAESHLEKLNTPKEIGGANLYRYYLADVLKEYMTERFYIEAEAELLGFRDFIKLAEELGGIPAYVYSGFEDEYLDELITFLKEEGFRGITYSLTQNTDEQLERLILLCKNHELLEILGESVNSTLDSFKCEALMKEAYKHLIASTWSIIGHEKEASDNKAGLFSEEAVNKYSSFDLRIKHFAGIGRTSPL